MDDGTGIDQIDPIDQKPIDPTFLAQKAFPPIKNIVKYLAVLLLIVAVPLTVFIAQQQQEVRQHAAGEQTQLYFVNDTDTATAVTAENATTGQQVTYDLYLDAGAIPISAFDVTVDLGSLAPEVTVDNVVEGVDAASQFDSVVYNFTHPSATTIRFAKLTTNTSAVITGKLQLIKFTVTPTTAGTGTVTISSATVTSPTQTTALSVGIPTTTFTITGSTIVPTPTTASIPTSAPTAVPTPTSIPTPTIVVPACPSVPTSSTTQLSLNLIFTGLGTSGVDPIHPSKQVHVELYNSTDTTNTIVASGDGCVAYQKSPNPAIPGTFSGTLDIGSVVPNGTYAVKVKSDKILRKLVQAPIAIIGTNPVTVPQTTLIPGDIVDDNNLDISDLTYLLGCYGPKQTSSTCVDYRPADLDDDGKIDGVDYTLFVRSLSSRSGD